MAFGTAVRPAFAVVKVSQFYVRDMRAVIAVTRRDAEGRDRHLHVCAVQPISGDPNEGEQEEQLRQEGG